MDDYFPEFKIINSLKNKYINDRWSSYVSSSFLPVYSGFSIYKINNKVFTVLL